MLPEKKKRGYFHEWLFGFMREAGRCQIFQVVAFNYPLIF